MTKELSTQMPSDEFEVCDQYGTRYHIVEYLDDNWLLDAPKVKEEKQSQHSIDS